MKGKPDCHLLGSYQAAEHREDRARPFSEVHGNRTAGYCCLQQQTQAGTWVVLAGCKETTEYHEIGQTQSRRPERLWSLHGWSYTKLSLTKGPGHLRFVRVVELETSRGLFLPTRLENQRLQVSRVCQNPLKES